MNGNGQKFRLLVLGGETKDVPRDRILCEFQHVVGNRRRDMKGEISFPFGKAPHVILCFKDYVRHITLAKFKDGAKILNIPFVSASGGFMSLVRAAMERHGIDLTHVLSIKKKGDKAVQSENATETVAAPAPVELDAFDQKVLAAKQWINEYPTSAFTMNVAGGQEVPVLMTKGGLALVLKGRPLEYALAVVKQARLGKGKRGALKQAEAREIAEKIETVYELRKFSVRPPTTFTIIERIGTILGTLPTPEEKKRRKDAADNQPEPAAAPGIPAIPLSLLAANVAEHRSQPAAEDVPIAKEPEAPALFSAMPGPETLIGAHAKAEQQQDATAKDFYRTLDVRPDLTMKISELYERIIDLSKENTAFIEQIGTLEAQLKAKDIRIKELEEKLRLMAR